MPKITFDDLQQSYEQNRQNDYINLLALGHFGTGKTLSTLTFPRPLVVHNFDPGGTESISQWAENPEKDVYVQDFSVDKPGSPRAYKDWDQQFQQMIRQDFFEGVGTFVLDSLTSLSESVMREQLRKAGRIGETPRLRDYQIQMATLTDIIQLATGLPCHFVLTSHIELERDEVSGKQETVPLVTGKLSTKIPTQFDEAYVYDVSSGREGRKWRWLTQPDGYYKARSRIAPRANLPDVVTADDEKFTRPLFNGRSRMIDFQKILRAAGKSWEHKAE